MGVPLTSHSRLACAHTKASSVRGPPCVQIPLDDVDPDDFAQLLEFVYSGIWSFPKDAALPLLELAQRFVVPDLADTAEGIAQRQLCHNWKGCCGECRSWAIPVAVAAEAMQRPALLDAAVEALARQPDKVGLWLPRPA